MNQRQQACRQLTDCLLATLLLHLEWKQKNAWIIYVSTTWNNGVYYLSGTIVPYIYTTHQKPWQ